MINNLTLWKPVMGICFSFKYIIRFQDDRIQLAIKIEIRSFVSKIVASFPTLYYNLLSKLHFLNRSFVFEIEVSFRNQSFFSGQSFLSNIVIIRIKDSFLRIPIRSFISKIEAFFPESKFFFRNRSFPRNLLLQLKLEALFPRSELFFPESKLRLELNGSNSNHRFRLAIAIPKLRHQIRIIRGKPKLCSRI